MSNNVKLKSTPKSCSPIASLKWFELAFKILKQSFWPLFSFALLTILVMQILSTSLSILGFVLSFIAIMFFTASIANNCSKIQSSKSISLNDLFSFNNINAKQILIASLVYFVSFLMLAMLALSPVIELFEFSEEQAALFQDMNTQQLFEYWEDQITQNPEKYAPLISSSFILLFGLILIEAAMFFVPILLAKHPTLNAFQAIKLSAIGIAKNAIGFILFTIILTPLMLISMSIYVIGFPIFLLIFKISSFIAYQEIFIDLQIDKNTNKQPSENSTSDNFDSREF